MLHGRTAGYGSLTLRLRPMAFVVDRYQVGEAVRSALRQWDDVVDLMRGPDSIQAPALIAPA